MRLENLFTRTLRDAPGDAEMVSHQLALRAGLVRPVAAGIYALMPLGWRVLRRIEAILRDEMEAIGGQPVQLPVVQPAEVWQATGRWDTFGPVLQTFETEHGRGFALSPTGEEVIAALAAREIDSYRQLPQVVYQVHTKYRNEPRPRGGLVRLREFVMKDAYSLHADVDDLDRFYPQMVRAYQNVFAQVGVDAVAVEADNGVMGGQLSHEFMLPHDQGEDLYAACDACDYAVNVEAAAFRLGAVEPQPLETIEKVATPDCKTIEDVAAFLGVPTSQTLKAVFFMHRQPGAGASTGGRERFVFAVVRGDLAVSETRLLNLLGGGVLRPAEDDEIRAAGAEPGYASPIGLGPAALVVADPSVHAGANFVAGANEAGYHLRGVNLPRDFAPDLEGPIAAAYEGAICGRCEQGTLHLHRAIELGHCFKLGTRYSEAVGATYQDEKGVAQSIVMGSYGIGLERLMAAIIEQHHDDWGIIWPRSVAPFDVHITSLGKDAALHERAGRVYADLRAAGLEVLLDDRAESPGVKFADADLIGAPLRITVSQKADAQGGVEVKWRSAREREIVAWDDVIVWAVGRLRSGA